MIVSNVNDFITAAVLEGVAGAPSTFMAQLEEALTMDLAIEKSGSVDNYLQEMIEAIAEELNQDEE